jgi:O-antigen ligase
VTTQPIDDVVRRRAGQGSLLPGFGVGLAVGLAVIYIFGQETRFAVYGLGAAIVLAFTPSLVRRTGSFERLLFVVLLFSYQIDVAVAYSFRPFKPAGPYGILISPILITAALLFALRAILAARRLGPPLYVDRRLVRWTVVMFLAGLASRVNTGDSQLVAFGLFEILTLALIGLVVADQSTTRDGLRLVQRLVAWILLIQSVLIIVSFTTGVQISLSRGLPGDELAWAQSGRFTGTLNTPSAAATMLVVGLLSALSRLYQPIDARERLWLHLQLGIGGFALLLTQTRTAWIGMVLGGVGILWAAVRRGELQAQRLLALVTGGLLVLLVAWPFIAARVEHNHMDDYETRKRLVTIAVEMIKAHPFLGIGLNTATSQLSEYAARAGAEGWVFIVHNQFLLIWAETGIFGLLAFIWLFRAALQAASRLKRSTDPELRAAGLWLFWSLVTLIWALNLDHVSGTATYKLVFLLFGVAAGATRLLPARERVMLDDRGSPDCAPARAGVAA